MSENNITISIEENIKENDIFIMNDFLDEIEKDTDEWRIPNLIHYHENFTMKELLLICEYYGIAKQLKTNKCNKETTIQILVDFESSFENHEIVAKRQQAWFYMNELKNDKFMKKYVLW